jgi:hypothetical protein
LTAGRVTMRFLVRKKILYIVCISIPIFAMHDLEMGDEKSASAPQICEIHQQYCLSAPVRGTVDVNGHLNVGSQGMSCCHALDSLQEAECVKSLNLAGNTITYFNLRALCNVLPNMRELDISQNGIEHLHEDMLDGMPSNFVLNLSYNPIRCISQGVDRAITRLRDKNIIIQLYDTQLPVSRLASFAESIRQDAVCLVVLRKVLLVMGLCAIAGGCAIMSCIRNDPRPESLQESGAVLKNQDTLLRICAIGCTLLGVVLGASEPIMKIFQHDMRVSSIFWR